jgi:hypothetical protein
MTTIFDGTPDNSAAVRAASAHEQPLSLDPTMSARWTSLPLMRSNVEQLLCEEKQQGRNHYTSPNQINHFNVGAVMAESENPGI